MARRRAAKPTSAAAIRSNPQVSQPSNAPAPAEPGRFHMGREIAASSIRRVFNGAKSMISSHFDGLEMQRWAPAHPSRPSRRGRHASSRRPEQMFHVKHLFLELDLPVASLCALRSFEIVSLIRARACAQHGLPSVPPVRANVSRETLGRVLCIPCSVFPLRFVSSADTPNKRATAYAVAPASSTLVCIEVSI